MSESEAERTGRRLRWLRRAGRALHLAVLLAVGGAAGWQAARWQDLALSPGTLLTGANQLALVRLPAFDLAGGPLLAEAERMPELVAEAVPDPPAVALDRS